MATEIRVPTLGESITEATVGKWFKKAGDSVSADEPLVELETDKVTLEVNAPSAGVLSEIAADTGQTVAIGALLGQLSAGSAAAQAPAAKPAPPPRLRPLRPRPPASAATAMPPSPAAAKIAAEDKIDLASIAGSGKRGQVLKGDVLAALAEARRPAPVKRPRRCRPPPQRQFRRRRPRRARPRPTRARAKSGCA